MNITSSRSHIKRRVDDYIWYDQSPPLRSLRRILRDEFVEIGEVAIIGGLVRDIARKGPTAFSSDVDLVLNVAPRKVERLAARLNAKPNRFGGFGVEFPRWKVDFWALSNTWAHRQGHVVVKELSDLTETTFFDIDAILYVVNTRRVIAKANYVDVLLKNTLDINLSANPSIDGNLVRTIRRVLGWNLNVGKKLRLFIERNLTDHMFLHIIDVEKKLYGWSFAAQYESKDALMYALLEGRRRRPSDTDSSVQLLLPL